jgi:DNA-binding winged helix-turn-helix (wHTH) protein
VGPRLGINSWPARAGDSRFPKIGYYPRMSVAFGECVFDGETRVLLRGRQPVHLTPKAFQLLEMLLDERPRALSKQQILQRLWSDVVVTEGSLANLVSELRTAIGDDAREPRYVRTVYGYGYAFAGAVDAAAAAAFTLNAGRYRLVGRGTEFLLEEGESLIGRAPDCQVRLDSATVSRHHARLRIEADQALVEDLGSKNGTFVGGQAVTGAVRVATGDAIRFGSVRLVFRVTSPETSTASYSFRLKA